MNELELEYGDTVELPRELVLELLRDLRSAAQVQYGLGWEQYGRALRIRAELLDLALRSRA